MCRSVPRGSAWIYSPGTLIMVDSTVRSPMPFWLKFHDIVERQSYLVSELYWKEFPAVAEDLQKRSAVQ